MRSKQEVIYDFGSGFVAAAYRDWINNIPCIYCMCVTAAYIVGAPASVIYVIKIYKHHTTITPQDDKPFTSTFHCYADGILPCFLTILPYVSRSAMCLWYSLLLIVLGIIYFLQLHMQLGRRDAVEAKQLCQSCTLPDGRLLWIFSFGVFVLWQPPPSQKATVYFISLATKSMQSIIHNLWCCQWPGGP